MVQKKCWILACLKLPRGSYFPVTNYTEIRKKCKAPLTSTNRTNCFHIRVEFLKAGTHNPRSEQLPRARVTAFSWTSLFLERFWREFCISLKFHKPVNKTYRPKNDIFCLLVTFGFPFDILYLECAHRHGGDSIFA